MAGLKKINNRKTEKKTQASFPRGGVYHTKAMCLFNHCLLSAMRGYCILNDGR